MNVKQSLLSTLVIVLLFIAPVTIAQRDNGEMSWEQLQARPYPQWFSDAKLGIFIHWGVYSVPSYGGAESYAEWFLLGLRSGNKDRVDFVKKNYGENFTYRDFAPLLKAELLMRTNGPEFLKIQVLNTLFWCRSTTMAILCGPASMHRDGTAWRWVQSVT